MSLANENNFEDQWKDAFSEASVPPPKSVWEGIEGRLDAETTFESSWKERFADASVLPAAHVWKTIERHLDQDDDILPILWWQNPKTWVAAASIVALLLVSSLFLEPAESPQLSENKSQITQKTLTQTAINHAKSYKNVGKASSPVAHYPKTKSTPSLDKPQIVEVSKLENKEIDKLESVQLNKLTNKEVVEVSKLENKEIDKLESVQLNKLTNKEVVRVESEGALNNKNSIVPPPYKHFWDNVPKLRSSKDYEHFRVIEKDSSHIISVPKSTIMYAVEPAIAGIATPSQLISADLRLIEITKKEPNVASIAKAVPVAVPFKRSYYVEAGFMAANFNANINIPAIANSAFNSNKGAFSKSIFGRVGVNLSKRLSIETGLGYLDAKSMYNDKKNYLSAIEASSEVAYSAGRKASTIKGNSIALLPQATIVNAFITQTRPSVAVSPVENQMAFVQIPVQFNYVIVRSPDGLNSISLLGGMIFTNFKKNIIGGNNNPLKTILPEDKVYQQSTKASLAGVRMQFFMAKHLSATVTAQYQKNLDVISNDQDLFRVRPTLFGLAWGVRYTL